MTGIVGNSDLSIFITVLEMSCMYIESYVPVCKKKNTCYYEKAKKLPVPRPEITSL